MRKKYILVVTEDDKGITFNSKSDGFYALEILGILTSKIEDIKDQMAGRVKPRFTKRTLVETKKSKSKG